MSPQLPRQRRGSLLLVALLVSGVAVTAAGVQAVAAPALVGLESAVGGPVAQTSAAVRSDPLESLISPQTVESTYNRITLDVLVAAAKGGTVVNASAGPDGAGLYLASNGSVRRIKPPKDPDCGVVCSFGFATTQLLGCNSQASCSVMAATMFIPGGVGSRAAAKFPALFPTA